MFVHPQFRQDDFKHWKQNPFVEQRPIAGTHRPEFSLQLRSSHDCVTFPLTIPQMKAGDNSSAFCPLFIIGLGAPS